MKNSQILKSKLDQKKLKLNEPLANYTTVKIGGPADLLYFADSGEDLGKAVKLARSEGIPVTVLGGGSNVLIADRGLRGLVIVNRDGQFTVSDKKSDKKSKSESVSPTPRWESDTTRGSFKGIEFKDIDYDESGSERVEVTVDSGVNLPNLLYTMIDRGLTGLQWYAGIPGTVGGAVVNNLHGGTHFFSEIVSRTKVLSDQTETEDIDISKLAFDYDKSVFHEKKWIVEEIRLSLYLGDKARAQWTANEWRTRKVKAQPQETPGCVFQNISQEDRERLDYPTTSVGFVVEHGIKMADHQVGKAKVSPLHHNFIENCGCCTAADYLKVMKDLTHAAEQQLKVKLVPEIFLLGFEKEELMGLNFD